MPSPNYAQNKTHIYKWRETHAEKYRELNRLHNIKYCNWKKISKIYLQILID